MDGAIYICPAEWEKWLPEGIRPVEQIEELTGREWPLLALVNTSDFLRTEAVIRCRILLVPGDCDPSCLAQVQAAAVITYGLSHRDSLTLSSLTKPVLCVQRTLPRPDGAFIEPMEFLLPQIPAPAEDIIPLLGLWLLQMPLTEEGSFW